MHDRYSSPELSEAGRKAVAEIAQRHHVSVEGATAMLSALVAGNGGMAQFNHPDFGGSGQWMRGGMTMVSNLFDHALKARVDELCRDLAQLLEQEPGLLRSGSFQSQSQGGQRQAQGHGQPPQTNEKQPPASATSPRSSLFAAPPPGSSGNWWPGELGWPDSTGAQNDVRYAWFSRPRRLAIDRRGKVTVYDTLDHEIGGFSQQQSAGSSLGFSSQHGPIELASLPVVSGDEDAKPRNAAHSSTPARASAGSVEPRALEPTTGDEPRVPSSSERRPTPSGAEQDVCALIERLAGLKAKGILSHEEFAAKKAELLGRV